MMADRQAAPSHLGLRHSMERTKSPADEVGRETLAKFVGTAAIIVNEDVEAGRRQGELCLPAKTYSEHKLMAGKDLASAIERFLPQRAHGLDIEWTLVTAHGDEALRWSWTATAPVAPQEIELAGSRYSLSAFLAARHGVSYEIRLL